jgi:hypothetical protein
VGARAQHVVAAADGAQEDLGAAVLVEEDGARRQLLRLGEQEAEHHGLARPRRPDDGEVAEVAVVEVEIVRTGRGGLQDRDRRAPVVAVALADREVVIAGEAGEVAARDQRAPADVLEIAGELGPERRLQVDVLAHRDDPQLGEGRLHVRRRLVEQFERAALHHHREVVLAEGRATGGHVVLGRVEIALQAHRLVVRRAHPAQRQVHPVEGRLAIDEAEAFGQHHLERQPQQIVEHPRRGLAGVVLDRQHGAEAGRHPPRCAQLQRVGAEADPAIGQVEPEVGPRQPHRPHLAVVEQREELERLRAQVLRSVVDGEQPRAVGREGGQQVVARAPQRAEIAGERGGGFLPVARAPHRLQRALQQADPALQRAAHQGQEELVDIEFAGAEPGAPGGVERAAEIVGERGRQLGRHLPPHDVVVKGEAGIGDPAQHRLAHRLAVVQLLRIRRLERVAGDVEHLQQTPVPGLDRRLVDVARIGQAAAGGLFASLIRARRAGEQAGHGQGE